MVSCSRSAGLSNVPSSVFCLDSPVYSSDFFTSLTSTCCFPSFPRAPCGSSFCLSSTFCCLHSLGSTFGFLWSISTWNWSLCSWSHFCTSWSGLPSFSLASWWSSFGSSFPSVSPPLCTEGSECSPLSSACFWGSPYSSSDSPSL